MAAYLLVKLAKKYSWVRRFKEAYLPLVVMLTSNIALLSIAVSLKEEGFDKLNLMFVILAGASYVVVIYVFYKEIFNSSFTPSNKTNSYLKKGIIQDSLLHK